MSSHRQPGFMTGISLLLPITLSTMAIVLLAPVLPRLLAEFSAVPHHDYWVPMILTVPALCVALFSPLAGIVGDWFGRRQLLLWSFAVYALVGIAPLFLTDLTAILISRVGVGMAEAMIMVLTTTMIGDYFKGEARDKWLAAQTAFASISVLLFLNIGGQLGSFGWRTPFWIYSSALIMLVLVLFFTWEPSERDATEQAHTAPHHAGWTGFPWTGMLGILVITVYSSVIFYTVQIQAANGLDALGLKDPARIGFLTSIASIGVPLGTLVYSRIGRWPVAGLLLIEFAVLALGFLIMARAHAPSSFLIGCFVNQLGAGMLLPTLLVWAMSLLSFENRARGSGLWTAAFSIGQFLSPLATTFAAKQVGGLLPTFEVFAAVTFAGAIGALVAHSRKILEPAHG